MGDAEWGKEPPGPEVFAGYGEAEVGLETGLCVGAFGAGGFAGGGFEQGVMGDGMFEGLRQAEGLECLTLQEGISTGKATEESRRVDWGAAVPVCPCPGSESTKTWINSR